jgi:hypothetical protein
MSTIAVDEVPSPLRDNRDISLSELADQQGTGDDSDPEFSSSIIEF